MNSGVMFIRIIEDANGVEDIIKFLNLSYDFKQLNYYTATNTTDIEKLVNISKTEEFYFVALIDKDKEIKKAFLGMGKRKKDTNNKVDYEITKTLEDNNALKNLSEISELDIGMDFGKNSYILYIESELIAEQIDFIINPPKTEFVRNKIQYEKISQENNLHELAQRNEYCRRQYNLKDSEKCRSEFQRDYERIVHSKAFRRMVDKAQVFSTTKGDHYRTRMTHSQIVAQISKGISVGLNLNEYLTEAIALGHDIGHTPFGHQGERTLDDILKGKKYDIIKNIEQLNLGGFKHNYQSVRVASVLEETYAEVPGMDLSFQTMEGMLKHTKLKREDFDIAAFVDFDREEIQYDLKDEWGSKGIDVCSTLEGQVVAIADEIAQRGHDLDDALTSGAIAYEEFKKYLALKKFGNLAKIAQDVENRIENAKADHICLVDEQALKISQIVSEIISYFIKNVIDTSKKAMNEYSKDDFDNDGHIVKETMISFSEEATMLNNYLETIINNKVINNPEVSLFDSNATIIISSLFKAYYDNPRLLHKGTMRKLYIDIGKEFRNVINFETGNHKVISDEIEKISHKDFESENEEIIEPEEVKKEYYRKREILIRHICDYISGMTDTYAVNEYNKIAKMI